MENMKEHVSMRNGTKYFEINKKIPCEYFNAVIFTCKMLYKGMPFDFAVKKSSGFYGVNQDKLVEYLPEYMKQ